MTFSRILQSFGTTWIGNNSVNNQGVFEARRASIETLDQWPHGNSRALQRYFLGRDEIILDIKRALSQPRDKLEQIRYVVHGMGGIGKSEICVKLFNDLKDQ